MRILFIILLHILFATPSDAQRLIRKNNRHYAAQQSLPDKVEPLLSDVWDQYAPFNNFCPTDSTGERCVVGCVATAMSQVMHYWQWPEKGRGSYTYIDSIGCGQELTANFSEHTYRWTDMLDVYNAGEYSQAQADAVAQLSLDCGISVNMRYGSATSGAESILQPQAMTQYFGYDKGMQQLFRDFYSLEEITLILKQELAAGRPILISGYSTSLAHAYVIDGYNECDWFHICWGNPGGDDNDYTYLPYMVPNQPQWYDMTSPENGLNILQSFTIGIMPENNENATGIERHNFAFQYISADIDSTMESATYTRDDVRLTVHDICNIGWNTLEDSVSLMLKKDNEIVCPLYTYDHEFLLEEVDDTTYTDTLSLKIPDGIADGTYTIVPMYRDNALTEGEKEWREARVCVGNPNYLITTIKDNEVTLSSDTASTAYLTLESIYFPDLIIPGTIPKYDIRLKNNGPEMVGRIYVYLESLNENFNDLVIQLQGMSIGADEEYTVDRKITYLPAAPWIPYRLHIKYESNLFADELIDLELPEEYQNYIVTIMGSSQIELAEERNFSTNSFIPSEAPLRMCVTPSASLYLTSLGSMR